MNFNVDREWLKQQATLEDNRYVSTGGVISIIHPSTEFSGAHPEVIRPAFVRLLELRRRERHLTLEQVADQFDINLADLIAIENEEHYQPTPQALKNLAHFMAVPLDKLLALAGLAPAKDTQFEAEALHFAEAAQTVEELSGKEHEDLERYVKFLCG